MIVGLADKVSARQFVLRIILWLTIKKKYGYRTFGGKTHDYKHFH